MKAMGRVCDITGQRFGLLVVLRRAGNTIDGKAMWTCRCDCGNEKDIVGKNLRNGNTKSCGCQKYKEPENLIGKRFGRLLVLERVDEHARNILWKCQCDCGATKIVRGGNLKNGNVRSCGCLASESSTRFVKIHGKSQTRLFRVWSGIKNRCLCKTDKHYKDYGGRGIKVCDEWKDDFQAFYDWAMGNGYDETAPKGVCTIDRIDNNKGYSPENCRFVGLKVQANNKRTNHLVDCGNAKITVAEATDIANLDYNTMLRRVERGWNIEDAINTPVIKKFSKTYNHKTYEYNGQEYTKTEIAKIFGIDKRTFGQRLEKGMSVKEAIETPVQTNNKHMLKAIANA